MKSLPVRYIIFDQDDVLFQHWPGLATTTHDHIYRVLAAHLVAKGVFLDEDVIRRNMRESYRLICFDNLQLAREHDLDRHVMHKEYHRSLLDQDVIPVFAQKNQPLKKYYEHIRDCIAELRDAGVQTGLLTHGDHAWAQEITPMLGLDAVIPFRRGVDSYGFRMKNTHECLLRDFLKDAGYEGPYEQVLMLDDRPDNLEPARKLGMQTHWITAPGGDIADGANARLEQVIGVLEDILADLTPHAARRIS